MHVRMLPSRYFHSVFSEKMPLSSGQGDAGFALTGSMNKGRLSGKRLSASNDGFVGVIYRTLN